MPSFYVSKLQQYLSKPTRNNSGGMVCISVSTFVRRQLYQFEVIFTSLILDGNNQAFQRQVRLLMLLILCQQIVAISFETDSQQFRGNGLHFCVDICPSSTATRSINSNFINSRWKQSLVSKIGSSFDLLDFMSANCRNIYR